MNYIKKKIKDIIKYFLKDKVLAIALLLGTVSSILVGKWSMIPGFIDWHTLILLFSLMAVMAGLQRLGFFLTTGSSLLRFTKTSRELVFVLVMLPFFFSMLITNDVALITFVPFALVVLSMAKRTDLVVMVVVLQTVAANMGSMMTPVGNPQNLYLYGISDIGLIGFLKLMAPYAAVAFIFLTIAICIGKSEKIDRLEGMQIHKKRETKDRVHMTVYIALFVVALAAVAKFITGEFLLFITVVAVVLTEKKVLKEIDYGLLLTFIGFFIFVGNMQQIQWFSEAVDRILQGREVLTAIGASQIISNVPAALLLSGFTDNIKGLIVGTNLGGLGTLIASMASLISYKQIASNAPEHKGVYLVKFTAINLLLLGIMIGVYFVVGI
ncbi:MAG: SLC13 family permease [Eubacterium sp.]|nr:SLC13 family permease [Eubacterium sp.]